MTRNAVVMAAAVLMGCQGGGDDGRADSAGSASGKADEVDTGGEEDLTLDHPEALARCELLAGRDKDRTPDLRFDAMISIESDRAQCLLAANDEAIVFIDRALQVSSSEFVNQVPDVFSGTRTGWEGTCGALVDASEFALDKGAAMLAARCRAMTDLYLGQILDAYVEFGGDRVAIKDPTELFPACFDAFNTAFEAAVVQADRIAATDALTDCIVTANAGALPRIADAIATNFPGRDPGGIPAELDMYVTATRDAMAPLCDVATQAGAETGDALDLAVATCRSQAAAMIGQSMDTIAPPSDAGGTGG